MFNQNENFEQNFRNMFNNFMNPPNTTKISQEGFPTLIPPTRSEYISQLGAETSEKEIDLI